MNDTEELITAALAKHAERAPHPGPILNALQKPRRRRVHPVFIAAIGTATVAAAVAVPLALRPDPVAAPPATQAPMPTSTETTPVGVPLTYTLADLPEGYTEYGRSATTDSTRQQRMWRAAQGLITLKVITDPNDPYWATPHGETVTVNGVQGWVRKTPDEDTATVTWQPEKTLQLAVNVQAPGPVDLAKRLAASVRPDGRATVQPLAVIGSLPGGTTKTLVEITGKSPGDRRVKVESEGADWHTPHVKVSVKPKGTAPEFAKDPAIYTVVKQLPDGTELHVTFMSPSSGTPRLTSKQQENIVESIRLQPAPEVSWLGTR